MCFHQAAIREGWGRGRGRGIRSSYFLAMVRRGGRVEEVRGVYLPVAQGRGSSYWRLLCTTRQNLKCSKCNS